MRKAFAQTVTALMAEDPKIMLLLGDIGVYSFKDAFEQFPDRCFNLGAAEQSMVGIGAGFAHEGFFPILHTIDAFMVRRAYEFIRLDFALQGLAGLFVTVGGADDYYRLGATHMCPEGRDLMGSIPGMLVYGAHNGEEVAGGIRDICTRRALGYLPIEERTP